MKYLIVSLLFFINFTSFAQNEIAKQDTTVTSYEFTFKDGTKLVGQIVDQDKESYSIKTDNFGTIKVASIQVVSIILIGQKTNRPISSSFDNQFGFKYFLFNSAIPVEPKKWFYTNQYLFFSNFSYGISKHISAGVSFFTFVPTSLISPHVKVTLNPTGKTKLAINGQYLFVRGSGNSGFFQALVTRGESQNNFTFGVGKFISDRGVDETVILTFAFVKKVGPKLSVISENNILVYSGQPKVNSLSRSSNTYGLLSAGLRFDRRMHSFDLGLLVPTSGLDTNINLLPYIGFNLKLSR